MTRRTLRRSIAAFAFALTLAACTGGGGTAVDGNNQPDATAGTQENVPGQAEGSGAVRGGTNSAGAGTDVGEGDAGEGTNIGGGGNQSKP